MSICYIYTSHCAIILGIHNCILMYTTNKINAKVSQNLVSLIYKVIAQQNDTVRLHTKHSPRFPSWQNILYRISRVQFLALLLRESSAIFEPKTCCGLNEYQLCSSIVMVQEHEPCYICPDPGREHNFIWCVNISHFYRKLYLYF